MIADDQSFRPASRIAPLGVSEILIRSAHAGALKQQGRAVIILGAGEPDFDTPDHVKAAACAAIARGETKYTALDGSADLKDAVCRKFARDNGLHYSRREITCSAGAKQILYNAFMASLEAGDEVIIPAPYWTSYADIVRIAGGQPLEVRCTAESGFLLSPERLEEAIGPRTRWLILNSPSNPSGATYDEDALRSLAEVIRRYRSLWVMSDDIYEHIIYNGRRFATLAQIAPDLRDRCLTVNGVSKAFSMTGWRLGFGAGPADLIDAMAIVQSQSTSCPSSVSQAAAIAALNGPQEIVNERTAEFQRRRDFLVDRLNAISGLDCLMPTGAFYVYPSCSGLIGTTAADGRRISDDRAFADYLLDWGVAVIPGSCFGVAPHFRISYAASMSDIIEATGRIAAACAALIR